MNQSELYIARLLFKTKVFQSDGQAYENLFINVMENANSNFQPVIGDRKNDGFDKTTGAYYQVYAPEDLSKKISTAEKNLMKIFKGLKIIGRMKVLK